MRQYADLTYVPPDQRVIDLRLVNWSRWAYVHGARFVQPMFRLYRPAENEAEGHSHSAPAPIDAKDALIVERAVVKLPEKHRNAVIWAYRSRRSPKEACQIIGVSKPDLAHLIGAGRQMLCNTLDSR